MLKLTDIVKDYDVGANTVHALKGVSIEFRPSEFVAILGQSGCGKTTLLNIIGGLDQYSSGDLIIKGKSTKNYKSKDWDTYRNHSVGFVFQSYNLIPHQTVLANVELALTLSGVKKAERRRRAIEALEKVGLGDQLHKKPNQMSGGQMQRVAIARALVNNPEILLADEPTGALDSETSVQVMELLKEIAKDRLVIMVTHNPELAEDYATRIVRLLDGNIIADSDPYDGSQEVAEVPAGKEKKASMSALTAFSLSLSNLMTKKGRAIMTAFAGSIGIIGIALILSISTGINNYIDAMERDTLSSYPLTLESQTMDMGSMMGSMKNPEEITDPKADHIYSSSVMSGVMDMMFSSATTNNLTDFKHFIESGNSGLEKLTSEIRYIYSTPLNVYKAGTTYQVNPSSVFASLGLDQGGAMTSNMNVWNQLSTNTELLESQYEVLSGRIPNAWNEVVLIVDENNRIMDYTLYALGVLDMTELQDALLKKIQGEDVQIDTTIHEYSYADFIGLKFNILPSTDYYVQENGKWVDKSKDDPYILSKINVAEDISIVGILRPLPDSAAGSGTGVIGYTGELMLHMIDKVNSSDIVKAQKANPDMDIISGLPFENTLTMADFENMLAAMDPAMQAQITATIAGMRQAGMSEDKIANYLAVNVFFTCSKSTYEQNLTLLGVSDLEKPAAINLYPKNFEAKDEIAKIIENYNKSKAEEDRIVYTDYVGLMMSSITTIINAISYILISFVAISLIVSSIMIGIITNISVLERTKEIGILRAVGASKGDVSRVFNAETVIEGLAAGLVGIGVTELLIIPINMLIQNVFELNASATLTPLAALILIGLSVFLTFIAGLIPAKSAANKDPVVALRSE